ncbi:SDR family NAD(P)-dependent oxidoreductase [Hansschlegelia quercus]|uniref:SDR family NAD(P)-dependent oxidoreductase n=1 Tax=Hansschlegelia quercus TaxID=2528245 RepID=A0A4Q9GC77_9HYPH|nr:SDR family NAD(P)-dependent oxidoreductase [Hansschlegelia quercus]TBN47023.1 SDR family NAD(P)-dependent oxidoreductase [Hansschlegelia quercus]
MTSGGSVRPLAVVTGASSGIGLELAKQCVDGGFDLVVASDDGKIEAAAGFFRERGANVVALDADLSTLEGVDRLIAAVGDRQVDALLANAGIGLAEGFLDQDFNAARKVVDTNVVGTLRLVHQIGNRMRARGSGRVLITGSIGGFVPGSYHAIYNATKAFLNSFSFALREELTDAGVTVTCLMPGATETEIFDRAGLQGTKAQTIKKDDPVTVAAIGFKAMMNGDGDVVSGWKNKIIAAVANVTPSPVLAAIHGKGAKPGSAD